MRLLASPFSPEKTRSLPPTTYKEKNDEKQNDHDPVFVRRLGRVYPGTPCLDHTA
jgi:hypothetical protein